MRVLFVGGHKEDILFSIMGFERALARELEGRCDFKVIRPGPENPQGQKSKWFRYFEKYVLFPQVLKREAKNADIVHFCESGMGMNAPHVTNVPTLVTVHDFLALEAAMGEFPGWEVRASGKRYQQMILNGVRQATALACVSETTLRGVDRHIHGYPGIVRLIRNSTYKPYSRVEPDQARSTLARFGLTGAPFFFHIGGNKAYKNRPGALKIYAGMRRQAPDLPHRLVMAGGEREEPLARLEESLGIGAWVDWAPNIGDKEVEAFYSLATALIFPSLAEGFGLPIIEAQCCGCPVFATNRAPMTEVGGQSAIYFDPTLPDLAAGEILAHMDNLPELVKRGEENVKRFDPRVMADAYLDLYRELTGPKA